MPLDTRVVLLIGADTAVVDESSYARPLTLVGQAARTTAQAKYGAGSITFDGTGDWVQAADSADFTLGAGDFTVEGWFRFVTRTDTQYLCGQWDNAGLLANNSWFLSITAGNLRFRGASGTTNQDLLYAWVPTLGTWYHLAADRSGSTLRLYINGAVVGTDAGFGITLNNCSHPLTLGAIGTTNTFPTLTFLGQMDEVRLTKGLAQYAGAFTPPTGPFSRLDPVTTPPVYAVGIGETEVTPLLATFRIQETIDAPDTMIADVVTVGTPFVRFTSGDPVVVTEDGVRIFGGVVTGTRERGLIGPSATDLVVEVQATSYELSASRRVITAAISQDGAETIGAAFASLVTDYYAEIGVSLHPDQVAGPALPAATFQRARGDAVNKQLASSVGYLQSIDFENRLRAWAPGDVLAPVAYDEAVNPELLTGDITVERQLQNGYANRVILVGDPITIPDHQDHFTGDGVTDTWPITYQVTGPYPYFVDGAVAFGIVVYPGDGTTESIGGVATPPGFLWEYDPIAQTIRRRGGPVAAGVAFYFPYHGLFVPEGMAEDAGEIAIYGLWEHVEALTAVMTDVSAQEYADALLAAKLASKDEIVRFQTRALGFHPGQTMTIVSSSRELSGEYLITQVDTGSESGGILLVRSITAAKSQNNTHDWRRVYQQWAGASAGDQGTASTSSGAGASTGLHAATHQLGGLDAIKLDDLAAPDDTTDLDATTSAHGLLPKLSGLDVEVLRGDGTWGTSPLTSGVFAYVFNTVTTAPPASQRIRFNAGHPYTAVTKLWADFSSSNSEDLYWGWMRIRVGSLIIVQDKDNHLQFAEFLTTGDPIDHGTYVELPVTWASNGTALAVQAVLVRVTAPSPGVSTTAFGTIAVSGQSDVVADAAPDTLTLVAGSNITLTTNAGADSITIAASGGGAGTRRQVTLVIDGAGAAITTGVKAFLSLPVSGTWKKWRILADASGSIVIDVWQDVYASYPPTVADTITASAKPTLSAAASSESSTLTGWTTAFTAGDVLAFKVDSATTVTKISLTLEFE